MGYNPDWHCYAEVVRPSVDNDSSYTSTHDKDYTVELLMPSGSIPVVRRTRSYQETFHYRRQACMPVISSLDQNFGVMGGGTCSPPDPEWSAEINESFTASDKTIRHIDLRYGSIVYDEKVTEITGSGSGDTLATGELVALSVGISGPYDLEYVVPVTLTLTIDGTTTEVTTVIDCLRSTTTTGSASREVKTAASDGQSQEFGAYYSYWPDFGVVDQDLPYTTGIGFSYSEKYVRPEEIDRWNYYPIWVSDYGTAIDAAQSAKYAEGFWTGGVGVTDESYEIPLSVDTFPSGSWAVARNGDVFVSQLTSSGVYNYLTEGDPVVISGVVGSNPVFFPIAPV